MRTCKLCGADIGNTYHSRLYCVPCQPHAQVVKGARLVRAEVAKAVRNGLLPDAKTLRCRDCGKPATQWEHRDYAKPLEVEPVCGSCNCWRGEGKPL